MKTSLIFGEELKKLLKAKSMKCTMLAQEMHVSIAYVSQLVTGRRRPGRETLLKLSKALDLPIDTLITLESNEYVRTQGTRKVPVLEGTKISQWLDDRDASSPLLFADGSEYAVTCDLPMSDSLRELPLFFCLFSPLPLSLWSPGTQGAGLRVRLFGTGSLSPEYSLTILLFQGESSRNSLWGSSSRGRLL